MNIDQLLFVEYYSLFSMIRFLLVPFLFVLFPKQLFAEDWGKTGHRVIGEVAQQHLTPKTAAAVNVLLDGMSLAFVSTYADEIRSDSQYDYLTTWHYVNMDTNTEYAQAQKNPSGDVITAIDHCVEGLKNTKNTKDERAFYLKLLVHFIGDIHQPMHVGRKADRGGNDIKLTWFGAPTNLHRLWDTDLIEHYNMSYSELAAHVPKWTPQEKETCMAAPLLDWAYESQKWADVIYDNTPEDAALGYVYHYQYFDVVRTRLHKAGLRLAGTLNAIFDSADAQ